MTPQEHITILEGHIFALVKRVSKLEALLSPAILSFSKAETPANGSPIVLLNAEAE